MTNLDLSALRRWPDIEGPELVAVDATDRLLLDLAADDIRAHPHGVLVIDDHFGALTIGALALGARDVRVHQDSMVARRALAANAPSANVLGVDELPDARVVLWQLPRDLDRLEDVARRLATAARGTMIVYAGGRIKHLTPAMNEVLRQFFGRVDVSHARQKSRALIAREPRGEFPSPAPRRSYSVDGIRLESAPGVFAGGRLDIGARAMLAVLDQTPEAATIIDLGCGVGILAAAVARDHPHARVIATDVSAVAVAATRRTIELNALHAVEVVHDDAGSSLPDGVADLVVLNPPFHSAGGVHTGIAAKLFAAAARLLRPGGELWTVYNSHLRYRPQLQRLVGLTRQIDRTAKFTVTASRKT